MLAERLKSLRQERGLAQRTVAIAINITDRNYQRFEYGEKPRYDTLIALADYFDVSIDYLVGRTDDPRRYR